jgi:hypothetical protein
MRLVIRSMVHSGMSLNRTVILSSEKNEEQCARSRSGCNPGSAG